MKQPNARALAAAREQGLRRVRMLTRTTLVGGLVGVGLLSAAVAHAFPGHPTATKLVTHPVQGPGSTRANHRGPAASRAVAPRPPHQAPVHTYQPPVTTSGGS